MIARPALPAVLAALTGLPVEVWTRGIYPDGQERLGVRRRRVVASDSGAVITLSPVIYDPPFGSRAAVRLPAAWTTRDPAEAWEILDARGLLPPEGTRGFWCRRCDGRGSIALGGEYPERDYCDVCSVEDVTATGGVRARGWTERPATIPDLVAWASLGAGAIVTAEALAVEACALLGAVQPARAVWRTDGRQIGPIAGVPEVRDFRFAYCNGDVRGWVTGSAGTAPPVRALWDMGLALERVGAECVLCVPPIGGAT